MEKICKNCKHWRKDQYERTVGVRTCKRAKMIFDMVEWKEICDGADYELVLKEEFKDEKHFVKDGSDYMAYLLTKGDFGCNQFES